MQVKYKINISELIYLTFKRKKIPGYVTRDKHKDITLAIIARGISQYKHLSRRSIALPAEGDRNLNDTGRRPAQAIYPVYRFSFSSTDFIRSSVKPKRAANFLKDRILLLGIREYILLMGVSLFNAFCTCFFFMELMY